MEIIGPCEFSHHMSRAGEHRLGIDRELHSTFNLILTTLEKLPTLLISKWSPCLSSNSSLTSPHINSLTLDCFMTLKRPTTFLEEAQRDVRNLIGRAAISKNVLLHPISPHFPPTFFVIFS